ncbi:hypothetical protein HaLaN_01903, partial [Haematococcus lacustris]
MTPQCTVLAQTAGEGRVHGSHLWCSSPRYPHVPSLAQLLLNGVVTLKKPRGQGLLRLYT